MEMDLKIETYLQQTVFDRELGGKEEVGEEPRLVDAALAGEQRRTAPHNGLQIERLKGPRREHAGKSERQLTGGGSRARNQGENDKQHNGSNEAC